MPDASRAALNVRLLGGFGLERGDRPCHSFDKARGQALIALLALRSPEAVPRTQLAFTFWPDSEEKQARTNLRNLIHHVRQTLPSVDSYLEVNRRALSWHADAPVHLDVQSFRDDLKRAETARENGKTSEAIAHFETALSQYRGDLLPSCYDEWIEPERENLRLEAIRGLRRLIGLLKEKERFEEAIHYAKILVQRDELSETAHFTLVELLSLSGDRTAALAALQSCTEIFEKELGEPPGEALLALREKVANRGLRHVPTSPSTPAAPAATDSSDSGEPPNATELPLRFAGHPYLWLAITLFALFATALLVWQFSPNETVAPPPVERSIAVSPFENRSDFTVDSFFTDAIDGNQSSEMGPIQSEIIKDLAISPGSQLSPNERKRHNVLPTTNLEALEAYFKGRAYATALADNASFDRSIAQFELACELDPDFASPYAELAHVHLRQIFHRGLNAEQQVQKANTLIERALHIDSELGSAYSALGTLKRYQDDLPAAIDAYEKAIQYSPNDAMAHYLYGNLLEWQLRDPERALEYKRKAVELDPATYGDQLILQSCLTALGRFDEALEIVESAIEDDPGKSENYFLLGRHYADTENRYDKAIPAYLRGFSLDPHNHNFAREIGSAFGYLNMYPEAAQWMQLAVEIAPKGFGTEVCRARAHYYRGDEALALKIFESVPPEADYYGWAVYYLSSADARTGRFETARDRILRAFPELSKLSERPINRRNHYFAPNLAIAFANLGETEKAERVAQRGLELFGTMPRFGDGGYSLGDAELISAIGDVDGALAKLQEGVDLGFCRYSLHERAAFDPLRDHPEFQAISAEIDARLAAQRDSLRERLNREPHLLDPGKS